MAKKKETYETKMEKLEELVSLMNKNQFTLEESMEKYEDGIKLCNELYKILNETEGKIKILTEDGEKGFNDILTT